MCMCVSVCVCVCVWGDSILVYDQTVDLVSHDSSYTQAANTYTLVYVVYSLPVLHLTDYNSACISKQLESIGLYTSLTFMYGVTQRRSYICMVPR